MNKELTGIKDYLQKKGQCKDKSISQKVHMNCEAPYIEIYVDSLSITFIYSVLLHGGEVATIKS